MCSMSGGRLTLAARTIRLRTGGENRPVFAPTLPPHDANDRVAVLPARQGDHGTSAVGVSQAHGNATGAVTTGTRSSTATHRSKKG